MSATEIVCARARTPVQPRPRHRGKAIVAAVLGASAAFGVVSGCVPAPRGDVVALAANQEGKPYVYGAAGPNAFDCSGLVQYVFRQAGRAEPRTALQQYNASTHISVLQAGRGDLVFYGAPRVYHVGIYVGGGQMIDAAHTGTRVRQEHVWPGAAYGHPRG
jgi:cell wall-associated NlpC family hydrolase